ncbi:ferrochelatase [Leeia sp. TBRC 13508]|uniref:Ferrochelatase n=1 Tax=Leeia speluncae TaxID=2884804 RepID=A0ABS8D8H5_9NEIS|nr:ferrochelatase [Leeia speluncae]MCB6184516.1 ferrochelatase [Leeia speluncae]
MSKYVTEPPFEHGSEKKIGVLLVNLGTPEAPTAKAVRPYLREFLSDTRVVEIPKPVWWLILNAFILPFRPKQSALKYASIWTNDGSPLMVHTTKQMKLLKGLIGERQGPGYVVDFAMRYGKPSVADKMQQLKREGCEHIVVLPLYPQYAASSAGSVMDAVGRTIQMMRNPPVVRSVKHFHDHPTYIEALAKQVKKHWALNGRGDHLLMSFHGVPKATLTKGDPYFCECHKTGRLLAEALGLAKGAYTIAFQSRFGKAEWVKPYTFEVLHQLGKAKTPKLDIICPGFVSDCLETLEEIAMEGKAEFVAAGGGEYRYVPCLNEEEGLIETLYQLVQQEVLGWEKVLPSPAERMKSREVAKEKGAKQ